jgi:glycosyltransferase involved in cell wall biosynthesis
MRIAQVAPLIESVPPKLYGGTERVVSCLTEELVCLGHDVTLFASGDSVTSARLIPGCERALRTDPACVDPLARHVSMLDLVFSHAKEFDLIHFHVDYLHFPLSRREPVAHLTTLHGRLDIPDLVPLYRRFSDMPVVSISDAQREPLPWVNWQGTVPHGLPVNSIEFSPEPGKYLAFLGRSSAEKGLDHAIEIAKRAGVPLKIAAKIDRYDAEYHQNHIQPLLDHPLIEFIGEIGYPTKEAFLANAAALLFPIQWEEPFGIVMIEALACGTPVIAYPRGSVPEVIEDGVSGFLVPGPEAAAEAVSRLGELDRRECRQRFETRFTSRRMVFDYLAIYERLVRGDLAPTDVSDGVLSG